MINVVTISLENEMDLVLAHRRSMKVAEKLGLTAATQTTFATAVSEIARTVIEHTDGGLLDIGLEQNKQRYSLSAAITFDKEIRFNNSDSGFYYAQKLVPEFNLSQNKDANLIEMKIGLPRSLKLDPVKINLLKKHFEEEAPLNAYDEIKQRNFTLNKIADEQEETIRQSQIINEKKTEFMSIASHEIKTPITILKAYTQMAKAAKEPISSNLQRLLEKIDTQSDKLISLVQRLLDVSKIENGSLQYNMQTVKLNDFIQAQVAVMKHILPHHDIGEKLGGNVEVLMDALRLEQVFSNLIGNAAKYSEKNTSITISTFREKDGLVTVAVTDNGKGISKENLKSVFDKFYRENDVVKTHAGLGMGLYITSKIISDHGGEIWVESSENQGSTFFFTLPYSQI